jgi:hypothetical protein
MSTDPLPPVPLCDPDTPEQDGGCKKIKLGPRDVFVGSMSDYNTALGKLTQEPETLENMWSFLNKHDITDFWCGMLRLTYYVPRYGWSSPTKKAVEEITKCVGNKPVLSICAGKGTWEELLRQAKVTFTAVTDIEPPETHFYPVVEALSAVKAVKKYGKQSKVLFLSWPNYEKTYANNALKLFDGDMVVYIGEPWGGCCADYAFFETLYDHGGKWKETKTIEIATWSGDSGNRCYVFERNENKPVFEIRETELSDSELAEIKPIFEIRKLESVDTNPEGDE